MYLCHFEWKTQLYVVPTLSVAGNLSWIRCTIISLPVVSRKTALFHKIVGSLLLIVFIETKEDFADADSSVKNMVSLPHNLALGLNTTSDKKSFLTDSLCHRILYFHSVFP